MTEKATVSKTSESSKSPIPSPATKVEAVAPLNSPYDQMTSLQRTLGNQAVQRLFKTGKLQAALKIGQPNDTYEQEADRVADQVMRMPDASSTISMRNNSSFIQRTCAPCSREYAAAREEQRAVNPANLCPKCAEENKLKIRRKSESSTDSGSSVPDNFVSSLGAGQPLDRSTREYLEPCFGADFSNVRVHTKQMAAKSASSINALAYTLGRNVVFGAGQYQPTTVQGKRLLAHELTHVVQQGESHRSLQRQVAAGTPVKEHGDLTQVPPEVRVSCNIAETSPADEQRINYQTDSFSLNAATRNILDDFARRWTADGTNKNVRIDGYASTTGAEDHNWRLSCSRATSVKQELMHPSNGGPGIPERYLTVYAHGETNRFSHDQYLPNQTATITSEIRVNPTPPPPPPVVVPPTPVEPVNKCGPDITSALSGVLSSVDSYFHGLGSWFRKRRSCMVLDPDFILSGVSPIMAWDTRELFLPNTGFLDPYFHSSGCGSPRDPGCDTDPSRNLCESAGTCGNTVLVGGKCMLAGTANYAIYGKMFKLCHDEFSPDYPRWDMRLMIPSWKALEALFTFHWDDPEPPKAMATSVFDGTFPSVPSIAENRGFCTGRCGISHSGSFDFIWEPYKPR